MIRVHVSCLYTLHHYVHTVLYVHIILYVHTVHIPQPLDAMGAVAEGGLLASLQVPWIAKRTAASAALALATVLGAAHAGVGLVGLWVGTKLLNVGTLALDVQHLQAGDTPMGPMQLLNPFPGKGMQKSTPRSTPSAVEKQ